MLLIGVMTCEARRHYAAAQRIAWANDSPHDVRFFLARQEREPHPDEVFLDCGDGYNDLPEKVREINRWTHAAGYELLFKVDDDVMVFPRRIKLPHCDYMGWKQEPASANWCSGLAYWLSRKAMLVMSQAELPEGCGSAQVAEDRWTGKSLLAAGIIVQSAPLRAIQWFGRRRPGEPQQPLPINLRQRLANCYAAGEFEPHEFENVCRNS